MREIEDEEVALAIECSFEDYILRILGWLEQDLLFKDGSFSMLGVEVDLSLFELKVRVLENVLEDE